VNIHKFAFFPKKGKFFCKIYDMIPSVYLIERNRRQSDHLMENNVDHPLVKNSLHTGEITGFAADGSGVCRLQGRAVFVPRALPGERWQIRIVKANRTAVWGRGEQLLEPSPHRCEPVCPAFGKCGGCAAMHMDYDQELAFKLDRVNSALSRIGGLALQAQTIVGADRQDSYRNKAIYNFAPGPVWGFYRLRSHQVIATHRCYLQPPAFDRAADALGRWMMDNHVPAYDETTGQGLIRHLYLRGDERHMAACLVATDRVADSTVAALRQACPELTGVLLCQNKERGNVVLSGQIQTLWGQDTWEETLCGAAFTLSPLTFFQVNSAQAEKLYRLAGEYAQPEGKVVLDLYCGAGTIGLSVARSARKLIGNDIVPSAVENARRNAQKNGVSQAEYFCGDAAQVAQKLATDGLHPDVIITDPPRKGMDKTVLDALVTMAPERIVYVSCDPGTLARDLKYLASQGYTPTHATAVDMFPRTHHVETVVLLTKAQNDHSIG
jgi:23S rRNA (uracil1939-C5)-methyltransferase